MKHIKKHRGKIPKETRKKMYNQARLKAKHILSKKHKEEYKEIFEPIYRKLIRICFKENTKKVGGKRKSV